MQGILRIKPDVKVKAMVWPIRSVWCAMRLSWRLRMRGVQIPETLERELRELPAFPRAILNDPMAHESASADGDDRAVADIADATKADPMTTFPTAYCGRACVSVQISHYCGTMYNSVFSHLNGVRELQVQQCGELCDTGEKQANLRLFSC